MLSNTYQLYRNKETAESIVRSLSYSLPLALHDVVDIVGPTTVFDGLREMKAKFKTQDSPTITVQDALSVFGPSGQIVPTSCNTTITPSCLQALYRTGNYTPTAFNKGNQIGITGYRGCSAHLRSAQLTFNKSSKWSSLLTSQIFRCVQQSILLDNRFEYL